MSVPFKIQDDFLETIELLSDGSKKLVERFINNKINSLISSVDSCESPIEEMLTIALNNHQKEMWFLSTSCNYVVDNQVKIKCGTDNFRVDLLISCVVDNVEKHYAIECDGHEFHQKNKEQVSKDYRKDRILKMYGIDVLRFSGSDIFNDVDECVREIQKTIFSRKQPEIKYIGDE